MLRFPAGIAEVACTNMGTVVLACSPKRESVIIGIVRILSNFLHLIVMNTPLAPPYSLNAFY